MEKEADRLHDYLMSQKMNPDDYEEFQPFEETNFEGVAVVHGFNLALDLSAHIIKNVAAALGESK